jgi:hypothetical protein
MAPSYCPFKSLPNPRLRVLLNRVTWISSSLAAISMWHYRWGLGGSRPRAPAVSTKSLYGNQLIATATTMHYLHGIPLGRVCEQTGLGPGSLVEIFPRAARLLGYPTS